MTPTGSFVKTARSHPARHIALDPYVRRIRAEVMRAAGTGRGKGSLRLRIGSRALDLDSWVLDSLLETSVAPEDDSPAGLLVEAVAFAAKCMHDADTLASTDRRDLHRARALQTEAVLNVALGAALLLEIQRQVDLAVQGGLVDHGRDWNRLRDTLFDLVTTAKRALGEEQLREADRLSCEFSGRAGSEDAAVAETPVRRAPIPLARASSDAPPSAAARRSAAAARRRPEAAEADSEAAREGAAQSASSLAIALVVAVVGVALLVYRAGGGAGLTTGEPSGPLPGAARLASLDARAMSASAVVRDGLWNELDRQAKLDWVNDLGRTLAKRGHAGFLLRLTSGRPVASWLATRGATLLEARDVSAVETTASQAERKKLF